MTKLGRFAVSSGLLAALLSLPCVCAAAEYEEPTRLCHDLAEGAYQRAKAMGDGLPDATYERVQANCEYTAWRAHLVASADASLNELVAFDHDSDSWLYEGVATPSEHEIDRQDAAEWVERCPNGYYDATADVSVCQ